MNHRKEVRVYRDREELAKEAALIFYSELKEGVSTRGRAAVILAGGSTPKECYRELARLLRTDRRTNDQLYWFLGDERWVPAGSPESNELMARQALLEPTGTPEERIFSWKAGEENPPTKARDYQEILQTFFDPQGSEPLRPDLLVSGLGEDGHTASLFPGGLVACPAGEETAVSPEIPGLAAAVYVPQLQRFRLTMTPRMLGSARSIYFLVSGEKKRKTLKRVLAKESGLPASWLNLDQTEFLVTRDAVKEIRV